MVIAGWTGQRTGKSVSFLRRRTADAYEDKTRYFQVLCVVEHTLLLGNRLIIQLVHPDGRRIYVDETKQYVKPCVSGLKYRVTPSLVLIALGHAPFGKSSDFDIADTYKTQAGKSPRQRISAPHGYTSLPPTRDPAGLK